MFDINTKKGIRIQKMKINIADVLSPKGWFKWRDRSLNQKNAKRYFLVLILIEYIMKFFFYKKFILFFLFSFLNVFLLHIFNVINVIYVPNDYLLLCFTNAICINADSSHNNLYRYIHFKKIYISVKSLITLFDKFLFFFDL